MRYFSAILLLSVLGLTTTINGCKDTPFEQGKILYENFCANCHMDDGSGLEGLIPPLAQADYYRENLLESACQIRYGMEGPLQVNGRTYDQPMPGTDKLTEFEITNILNYINASWYSDLPYVKLQDVRTKLEACKEAREK